MLVIGLTGSIGMGKSTVAAAFRKNGFAVFDADAAVHDLYDGAIANDIEIAFPGTVVDGKVDRARLSAALLSNPDKFERLEAIVHPRVRAMERAFLDETAARGAIAAVLEIPLLFESDAAHMCDVVVVVSAKPDIQRARVLERPGMTEEKLTRIISRQMSDAEKRKHADFVVETSGAVENCHAQISQIIAKLQGRTGTAYTRFWR